MNWLPNRGVDVSICLEVDDDAEIKFLVSPTDPDSITLAIGNSTVEISFDPAMVETLRDKADQALTEFHKGR